MPVANGSLPLQLSFVALALALVGAAVAAVPAASIACGDPPEVAHARGRRFILITAAWLALVTILAASGLLADFSRTPPPFMPLALSMVILGVVLAQSETGDRLARGIPLAWLVGIQAFRFPLELAMHRAYTEGLMPVQMSYSGRNFDIVTGITAAMLAAWLAFGRVPRGVVMAWNLLGLALLANIVGVALLSTPMVQYFGPDQLNTFVARLPYTLLPMVMVLAAWAGHLLIFRALAARR